MAVSANRLELLQIADAVAREKAIDRGIVITAMEDAIAKAARSRYGAETDVHEIQVESLGGDVVDVEVSAIKKTNIDKLLEMLGLQAEILDLKADPARAAEGTVIEAKLDRGRGPVATVLVQRGTLHARCRDVRPPALPASDRGYHQAR